MGTFIAMFMALMLASIINICLAFVIFMNKRFMKWYSKKVVKLTQEITEELEKEY